jgi:hypothetical protein
MPDPSNWIVTTAGDRPIDEIVTDVRRSGFTIDQVLDEIGCITGAGSDDVAQRLRGIRGVVDVSRDAPIDIGPPDSSTTW